MGGILSLGVDSKDQPARTEDEPDAWDFVSIIRGIDRASEDSQTIVDNYSHRSLWFRKRFLPSIGLRSDMLLELGLFDVENASGRICLLFAHWQGWHGRVDG